MHRYLAPALAALLLSCTSFAAQERPPDKETFTSAAQANLSPDLQPLAFLEGTWDVEQRFVLAPMGEMGAKGAMKSGALIQFEHARDHVAKPDQGLRAPLVPGTSKVNESLSLRGTFEVKRDLAGRAFIGRFESEGMRGEGFFGHMILTAEKRRVAGQERPEATAFTSYWADSNGITTFTKDVTWQHDTLSIQAKDRVGDQQGEARVTYRKLDENRIEFNMEMKLDGDGNGNWRHFSTATYTRSAKTR